MRSFGLLVGGYSVSVFGNFLNLIALNLFAFQVTGSALQTGLFMTLRLVAGFATGLVAGRAADRLNRKALLIGCDLAQAAVMVAVAVAPAEAAVVALYPVAVVLGAGNTVFNVTLRSSVPDLVGQDQRVRANGLLVTGKATATVLGFASAGIIVGAAGYTAAFLINAASFCVSAAAVATLRYGRRGHGDAAGPREHLRLREMGAFLGAAPLLAGMVLLRATDAFSSSSHNVALPAYASQVSPADPAAYLSWFWASWALGSVISYRLLVRGLDRWGRARGAGAFAVGTALMSVFFVLAFTGPPLPLLVVVGMCAGLADGFTEITYTSRLQAAPERTRALLFGVSATAENAGFAAGMLVASFALEGAAPLAVVAAFHGLAIIASGLFLAVRLGRARRAKALERH
ncbi:MFS transporter [Bailinhaonella thermotolerans]|uniref:MFS transporter n=1 Tax=Bailinhaonella thermotolerans TaxID=1070861 RepID=A0A3A4B4J5_9ACTN|nr:MFS transporter [Bailinhaonella thermotolerans]RJL33237.1 MFS transporter [Bailinhaonella thermotolerans]